MTLLGAHFPIAGGLENAVYQAAEYNCNTLQIFTKNSKTWKEKHLGLKEISLFEEACKKTSIETIVSHTSYLINLASPDDITWFMSCEALKHELIRTTQLSIKWLVLHPGAHMGTGEEKGMKRIARAIDLVFEQADYTDTCLVLETTAGQGTSIGKTFEQLAYILNMVKDKKRLGICLDSSHIFAAGYDILTMMSCKKALNDFDKIIGLEKLRVIHLNDSKTPLDSRVDRHEHIGEGYIGKNFFEYIMNSKRFNNIPKILETPKIKDGLDYDHINLKILKGLIK